MDSGDFPAFGQAGSGGNQKMVYQAKKQPSRQDSDFDGGPGMIDMPLPHQDGARSDEMNQGGQNSQMPFFTNAVQMNLC